MAPDGMEDLRSRLVGMEHRFTELSPRVTAIELRLNQKDVSDAETRVILLNLVESMKGIRGGISKLLWLVGGAIAVAVVTWIISGGLKTASREVSNASIFGYPQPSITTFAPIEKPACNDAAKPVYVAGYCRAYPFRAK